jgi:hypothetical protein
MIDLTEPQVYDEQTIEKIQLAGSLLLINQLKLFNVGDQSWKQSVVEQLLEDEK